MFLKLQHQSLSFIQSPLQRVEQALKSASLSCKCNSKYGDNLKRYFGYRAFEKIHQGFLFICRIYASPCPVLVFHCMYFSWNINSTYGSFAMNKLYYNNCPWRKKEREDEGRGKQRRRGWVVVGVTDHLNHSEPFKLGFDQFHIWSLMQQKLLLALWLQYCVYNSSLWLTMTLSIKTFPLIFPSFQLLAQRKKMSGQRLGGCDELIG